MLSKFVPTLIVLVALPILIVGCTQPETDGSPAPNPVPAEPAVERRPTHPPEPEEPRKSIPHVHRRVYHLADFDTPQAQLGARLFRENRMSNPGSQYLAACTSCHKPPDAAPDARAYADNEPRSLTPSVGDDMKSLTGRNTPTLLDVALAAQFNWDGAHPNLEDTIRDKLLGRQFGWVEDQREQAINEIHALILNDIGVGTSNDGEPYVQAFNAAYDVKLSQASGEDIVDAVVTALADYVRLLTTPETAPYDAMAYLNRFGTQIEDGEQPADFSGRLFGRIANIEGRGQVKFPEGINELEYQGFKIFMRMYPGGPESGRVGNCVACHHPPKFTDFAFHNTGVAQMEYDALHGDGAFAQLTIPDVDARRPVATYASAPDPNDPAKADLGHWNYIETSDEDELARAVGAFKTPPLRNLDLTEPYMHNGQYDTIEDAIRQKIEASRMAKEGTLINPDPAFLAMDISEDDVAPLAAFLYALNEVDPAHFREIVLENTRIRPTGF